MKARMFLLAGIVIMSGSLVRVSNAAPVDYALNKTFTSDPAITTATAWWLGENPPWTKFTDGISDYNWNYVTGWQGPDNVSSVTLVVDLGAMKTDIETVRVDQFVSHSSTVYECNQIKCFGSTDGSTFTYWGDLATSGTPGAETMWYWTYKSLMPRSAQYVKYELYWPVANIGSHKLLSEISVWSAAPLTDVALSQGYTSDPVPDSTTAWWLGENPPYTKFTDGVSSWSWTAVTGWQGPDAVSSVTLVVDLGAITPNIVKAEVDQFVSHGSAVYECNQIKCYGSDDGISFTSWGDLTLFDSPGTEAMWYWVFEPSSPMSARYVKYELYWPSANTLSHKLLSEVEVYIPLVPPAAVKDWMYF